VTPIRKGGEAIRGTVHKFLDLLEKNSHFLTPPKCQFKTKDDDVPDQWKKYLLVELGSSISWNLRSLLL
jgi:hypothetical protein